MGLENSEVIESAILLGCLECTPLGNPYSKHVVLWGGGVSQNVYDRIMSMTNQPYQNFLFYMGNLHWMLYKDITHSVILLLHDSCTL